MDSNGLSSIKSRAAYICKNPLCLVPITMEQLPEHLKKHKDLNTEAVIESFDDYLNQIRGQMKGYKRDIEANLIKRENFREVFDSWNKVNELKEAILKSIASIFDSYISANEEIFEHMISNMNELCEHNLYEIEQIETEFDNIPYEPENLKLFNIKLDKISQKMSNFKSHLKEYTQNLKSTMTSLKSEKLLEYVEGMKSCFETNRPSQQDLKLKPFSLTNFDQVFEYSPKEYFVTGAKVLPFFKENTKEAYLLDLEKLISEGASTFKKLTLNIDFKIPKKHSSIITPNGNIFLMGGAEPDYNTNKLNKTYLLDETSLTLLRKAPFAFPRVSAGCIFFQGHIYLIGGKTTKEGYTNKCEKYSIKFDKWIAAGSMTTNTSSPILCNFNDQYIYKFGGMLKKGILNDIIEKYSPISDKWSLVPFKGHIQGDNPSLLLGFNSHALQVSQEEILVFGGLNLEYKAVADNFLMYFEEDNEGGKPNKWKPGRIREKFKKVELGVQFPGEKYGDTVVFKNRIYSLRSNGKETPKIVQYTNQFEFL